MYIKNSLYDCFISQSHGLPYITIRFVFYNNFVPHTYKENELNSTSFFLLVPMDAEFAR